MLSLPLVAVFLISNWLSLTCGFQCGNESQSPVDHSSSLHAEHARGPDSKPFAIAGQHTCGTHAEGEVVFSPKRVVQMNELTALAEMPSASDKGRLPNSGARLDRPWRWGFPLSQPQSLSVRI